MQNRSSNVRVVERMNETARGIASNAAKSYRRMIPFPFSRRKIRCDGRAKPSSRDNS